MNREVAEASLLTVANRLIPPLPGGSGTPIMPLTGSAIAEDSSARLAAGMDGFLDQPVKVGEMSGTALKELVRRRQRLPTAPNVSVGAGL